MTNTNSRFTLNQAVACFGDRNSLSLPVAQIACKAVVFYDVHNDLNYWDVADDFLIHTHALRLAMSINTDFPEAFDEILTTGKLVDNVPSLGEFITDGDDIYGMYRTLTTSALLATKHATALEGEPELVSDEAKEFYQNLVKSPYVALTVEIKELIAELANSKFSKGGV